MQENLNDLKKRLSEINDINHAVAVLGWDQQTYMPSGGAAARARQLATLSHIAHEKFIDDAIGRLLGELHEYAGGLPYDSDDASLIRVTKRDYDKARRVPSSLVSEIVHASAHAFEAWRKARNESRFSDFAPYLQRNLDLKKHYAKCLGYTDCIYDPLLDEYEPGMKTSQVKTIFQTIKRELVPLVQTISAKLHLVDNAFLHQVFDEQAQWDIGIEAARLTGYDFERGRQDRSPHPFTTSFSVDDVRITTRILHDYFPAAFFATLHEVGHALYNQGIRPELEQTPLADGASLGAHESQSRLWENLVGRSRPFWKFFMPRLQTAFPEQFRKVIVEKMYCGVNRVEPSFIRVEADEITYNLHIMMRFELENALLEERLPVNDLPEAWNKKMQEYLGIVPPDDTLGVLQDVHWSHGSFGYFPTYSLGNIFAAQLFDTIKRDIPDLDKRFEQGEFHGLLDWLRTHLHTHGRKFTLDELAKKITGASLQTDSFIAYLKGKYGEMYHF
ncbi:MAG: carboxypeptidase [Candidatus Brocadia sp. UTAMX2]|jgi:carboxypeptidase Taq|nr:MAG: carboxypeptidase [Candidatus Brocadia sp. UTAMX2]